MTVLAGLTVAATFFLPLTNSRIPVPRQTSPTGFTTTTLGPTILDVPLLMWTDLISQLRSVPLSWWRGQAFTLVIHILALGLPYFWGLMMGLYSLAQLAGRPRARRLIWSVGFGVSLTASALGLLLLADATLVAVSAAKQRGAGLGSILADLLMVSILGGLVAGVQVYALLALRHGPWKYLYHGFVAALAPVIVVVLIAVLAGPEAMGLGVNGVTAMMVGLCLLLAGRVGEARAVSRASWFGTLVGLCFLRLERWAIPAGHCTTCGYNLTGNTSGVCPECGSGVPGQALAVAATNATE